MKAIEMKDLLGYRFLSAVQAAPQADRAAFVVSTSNEKQNRYDASIWLYEKGATRRLTGMGKERRFMWEDDTHILFPAVRSDEETKRSKEKEVFTSFYRLDIAGGEAEKAFELPLAVGELKPLVGDLWYCTASVDMRCPDFYKLSAKKQAECKTEWAKDADYHVLTRSPWWFNGQGFVEEEGTQLFVYNIRTRKLERISCDGYDVESCAVVDGKLYFTSSVRTPKPNEHTDVYCYDPAQGQTICICQNRGIRVDRLFAWQDGLAALGVVENPPFGLNQNPAVYTFDEAAEGWKQVYDGDEAFGSSVGSDCRLGGGQSIKAVGDALYYVATVRNRAVLKKLTYQGCETVCDAEGSLDAFDIAANGRIYGIGLYDMRLPELYDIQEKPHKLTRFNDKALANCYVAKPEKLTVDSCGWDIDGWVLYPKDYDPEKTYPAVLDIHGGPKTVYGEVFYHEMQLWASKGWFVFFCNPFGGDGRGNRFMDIRKKYGTDDYQNIMDFTDAVLARFPQIDTKRVGVTGGSYGGFMTNWIVGHTGRFACAASQRSISNWISFYGTSDIGIIFTRNEQGASPYEDAAALWEHSPLKHAGNITTPTLFIHSDEDYRCPIPEAMQLYNVLIDRGIETRLVWFKGENHELSRSGKPLHRMRRLLEITQWMEKYIG